MARRGAAEGEKITIETILEAGGTLTPANPLIPPHAKCLYAAQIKKNKVKLRNLMRDATQHSIVVEATEEKISACTSDLLKLQRTLRKIVDVIKQGHDNQQRLAQEMRREMSDNKNKEPEMAGGKTSLRREANLQWRTW